MEFLSIYITEYSSRIDTASPGLYRQVLISSQESILNDKLIFGSFASQIHS